MLFFIGVMYIFIFGYVCDLIEMVIGLILYLVILRFFLVVCNIIFFKIDGFGIKDLVY